MEKGMVLIRRWYAAGPLVIALAAALIPGTFFAESNTKTERRDHRIEPGFSFASPAPAAIVRRWPPSSRGLARAMLEKYGGPDLFGETALIWYDKGAWKRTIAYRDAGGGEENAFHLKQSVLYRVPDDKIPALRRFDRRISIDKELKLMSVQSDSESTNFLALNLARDIVAEKRSVEDASDYRRKTMRLSAAGKSQPYVEGLVFSPENAR